MCDKNWCFKSSPKLLKDSNGQAHYNVLKELDICLELWSDSEEYFRFVVDKFSYVHTGKKSRYLRHLGAIYMREGAIR